MPLRSISHGLFAAVLLLAGLSGRAFGRGPEPTARIRLEGLGYLAPPTRAMLSGDAISTIHFVDDRHLLLTYSTRTLLSRLPDEPSTDEDRNVAALLLELPSGKVLARTEWRTHDHRPYLWPLTHGNFLLRIRNVLYLFAPVANLQAGREAFQRVPFLRTESAIGFISITPAGDLLILQTIASVPVDPEQQNSLPLGDVALSQQEAQINFYRLREPPPSILPDRIQPPLIPVAAGVLRAAGLLVLPVTAEGYLEAIHESDRFWGFDFFTHTGKKRELAGFDSVCPPLPLFVSAAELISYSCRRGAERTVLDGFNLSGEHMWTKELPGGLSLPWIATAPSAGRFATGRLLLSGDAPDPTNILPEQISSQEVTVTQTWTGQDLFKISASPAQRGGQNFDLSADGQSLAVLREGNIEIYRLPALSGKDREAIALAGRSVPEPNEAVIRLSGHAVPPPVPHSASQNDAVVLNPDKLPTLAPVPELAEPEQTPTRDRPTLYGPGEKPQK